MTSCRRIATTLLAFGAALLAAPACGGTGASIPAAPDAGAPSPDGATVAPDDGAGAADASTPADTGADAGADLDRDGDGIGDAREAAIASAYLPFISLHGSDACKTHGILYRLSPHPKDAARLVMWTVILYDKDCGAGGHAGDDEVFGVLIDPARPAPDGILAVRAISHQGTPCEKVTTCGACGEMPACSTGVRAGKPFPVVYPSRDKHGNYVDRGVCASSFICDFGGCELATAPDAPPLVNAGEPKKPLVKDLTDEGFITKANGWTNDALFHFDPWKPGKFGGAGDVSSDLVDAAFVVDTTACK